MIIIPKGNPVVQNLNSYYLDINKMIEHYQGEIGSGCIHFISASYEGLFFFDKDDLLNGIFKDINGEITGMGALDRIIQTSANQNFNISIFKIDTEYIYFWANIPNAKKIHSNLSTEFTDLEKLIKKLSNEQLTGFIDISINRGNEGGYIFFSNGEIIGNFFSGSDKNLDKSKTDLDLLYQETADKGGVFNVSAIQLKPVKSKVAANKDTVSSTPLPPFSFSIIEDLLTIIESTIAAQKKLRVDFNSALKKKFLEKISKYEFLDPFSAELKYLNGKIVYEGKSDRKEVITGVIECSMELVKELNLSAVMAPNLQSWSQKYSVEIKALNISF